MMLPCHIEPSLVATHTIRLAIRLAIRVLLFLIFSLSLSFFILIVYQPRNPHTGASPNAPPCSRGWLLHESPLLHFFLASLSSTYAKCHVKRTIVLTFACSYRCLSLPDRHKVWCGKLIKKRETSLVTQGRNGAKCVYLGEKTILSL